MLLKKRVLLYKHNVSQYTGAVPKKSVHLKLIGDLYTHTHTIPRIKFNTELQKYQHTFSFWRKG